MTADKTCKTCRSWHGHLNDQQSPPEGYGQCTYLVQTVAIFRSADRRFEVPCYSYTHRPLTSDGAGMIAGDEYKTMVITAPDFGCTQWKAKE